MIHNLGHKKTIHDMESEVRKMSLPSPDAEQEVAKRYGFLTWRQLIVHLLSCSPSERTHPENHTKHFHRLACLGYSQDRADQYDAAAKRLAEDPRVGTADIWSAACSGDVQSVKRHLDSDPNLLEARGGFFDWEPLLYATYGRIPGRSTLDVARVLLELGADPNAYYLWGGAYRFTALTGAFGHGEGGPTNCPEHPDFERLARALLEAGARPNDAQALYNRMFADRDSVCLKLLLEYGLSADATCNWRNVDGDQLVEFDQQLLQYQLSWAIENHYVERARILVEHGADLAAPAGQRSYFERAALAGEAELAEFLVARGAERISLHPVDQLAAALRSGDEDQARRLLLAEPLLQETLIKTHPDLVHRAAASGQLNAIRACAALGIDLCHLTRNTPLHQAAWHGQSEAARLLVSLGADPSIPDRDHHSTPAEWARHAGNQGLAEELERLA